MSQNVALGYFRNFRFFPVVEICVFIIWVDGLVFAPEFPVWGREFPAEARRGVLLYKAQISLIGFMVFKELALGAEQIYYGGIADCK